MKKTTLKAFFLILALSVGLLSIISCTKPGDADVTKGMEALRTQRFDDAAEHFKTALEKESNYSNELLCSFLAKVYTLQENYPEAIKYFELALEKGGDYLTYVSLGMAYHLNNDDENAIKTYEKAIAFNPKKAEAYAALGALQLGNNIIEEAEKNLLQAVTLSPKLAIAHGNLAIVYAKKGEKENCEAELLKAEQLQCESYDDFKFRCEQLLK